MRSPSADPALASLTIPEASRMLGVSPAHGYRLARRGEFPGAFRLGEIVRVNLAALMAWQAELVAQAERAAEHGAVESATPVELARLPLAVDAAPRPFRNRANVQPRSRPGDGFAS